MAWPAHYPPGCPGSDPVPADGQVWRIVRSAPPQEKDFKSNRLQQPRKDWGEQECEACGLSVYRTERDAARVRELTPAFRKRLIASATLTASHGVTLSTPRPDFPSHTTWWVLPAVEPWTLFAVSDEVRDDTP